MKTSDPTTTPNFDALARPYRWLEYLTFGPYLQRTRTCFLSELETCRRALVLGDGDGRFTAALLRANPSIHVHAIDASPAMLRALQKSAGPHADRLTTEAADLRQWSPRAGTHYDLVATHFFLDCLTTPEIAVLAARLSPALAPQARWVVSDFAIPATKFGALVAAPLVAALYRAFSILTHLRVRQLPNHRAALESSGWAMESEKKHLGGLLLSQLWHRR